VRVEHRIPSLLLALVFSTSCSSKAGNPVTLRKASTVAKCEQASKSWERDRCYRAEAKATGNRGLCLQLNEPWLQASCVADFADAQHDISACEQASAIYPVPDCFKGLAQAMHDPQLCLRIANVEDSDACIQGFAIGSTYDARACALARTAKARDLCRSQAATHDAASCAQVENPARRQTCLSRATDPRARASACAVIDDAGARDVCYINQANASNLSLCERTTVRKNDCWVHAAVTGGPAICEQIGAGADSVARSRCLTRSLERPLSCVGITDPIVQQECLLRTAKDPHVCETINDAELADICWATMSDMNADLCLRIKQPEYRRDCAHQAWPRAKDVRLCAELPGAQLQSVCSARVGLNKR